jgi:protein associated with RNAse G/E
MNEPIRVYKLNEKGENVWHYDGKVLSRSATMVKLEARFNREDYAAGYHTFRRGDRFVEWFYSDRWYNIFQMHDVDDDRIKGWYCNMTRPALLQADAIYAEDLALDLMVYPNGRFRVLDEDEFAALRIKPAEREQALRALVSLKEMVRHRKEVFARITR